MLLEAIWIGFAFTVGFLARVIGLPPLVGYLLAGFLITLSSQGFNLPQGNEIIAHIAHFGVLLLLFTVGLKLNLKSLTKQEVLGGSLSHFFLTVLIYTPIIFLAFSLSWRDAVLLGAALAFSSTVLAAKVLEGKREIRAFHGRVAIGILIMQDLIAMAMMSISQGVMPSPWALLIFVLPLLKPLLFKILSMTGHEDLQILFGVLLAVVLGGGGFALVGLSSELGALVFGALMASHPRAGELAKTLWAVKEFFLVGFFLKIGLGGLPDTQAWMFALLMTVLLPLKGILFFALLVLFKLRARSAFLSSLTITNYSEFALIVASVVMPQYLIPLALTVALSFVVSAPLNRYAHPLYEKLAHRLIPFERNIHHPDEQPVSLGDAEVLIMGMGRTGCAAYEYLQHKTKLAALDSDPARVAHYQHLGENVFFADAEDQVFWQGLHLGNIKAVILCLSDVEAKLIATRKLRQAGFGGLIVSHSMQQDEAYKIMAAGADHTYLTMNEAGLGLAERVRAHLGIMA
jgi:predicted Kef-type K+ transport protein